MMGRQVIEEMIRTLRPKVSAFSWTEDRSTDTYLLSMTGGVPLRISQCAVDQAAEETSALPRLKREIESALRVSESGEAIGFVWQVYETAQKKPAGVD
jgi:hypothetical protein